MYIFFFFVGDQLLYTELYVHTEDVRGCNGKMNEIK